MKLHDILYQDVCIEESVCEETGEVLTEATVRQFKKLGKKVVKRYRCLSGAKKGKLVADPSKCAVRKDPRKVRQGRKTMRSKKGIISRKGKITKRKSMNKVIARMNKRMMGK